jgi:hypothetical protein
LIFVLSISIPLSAADVVQLVKGKMSELCNDSNIYDCNNKLQELVTIAEQYQNNPYRKYIYRGINKHIYLIDNVDDFGRILGDLEQSNLKYHNAFAVYVLEVLAKGSM